MHHLKNSRHSHAVHLFAASLVLFALLASACADGDIVTENSGEDGIEEGLDPDLDENGEVLEDTDDVSDEEPADTEEDLELAEDDAFEEPDCSEGSCDDDDLTECDDGVCDLDEPIDECDGGSCDEIVEDTVIEEDLCGGQACVAPADYDWPDATCVSTVHVPSATIPSASHLAVAFMTFGMFANAIVEWEVPGTPGTTTVTLDADGNGELEVGLDSYGPYTLASMTVNGEQVPVDGFPELVVDAAEGPIHGDC